MNRLLLLFIAFFPLIAFSQGQKGQVESCAPTKEGKVCYSDKVDIKGASQESLFEAINKWAKENYGGDVFISSVSSNKKKGTIFVGSKVELALSKTDKTIIKYKMRITCKDGGYSAETSDISYRYSPEGETDKLKSYPAEDVIIGNGKGNKVTEIRDPKLFCNATYFFVESLFADLYDAVKILE